MPAMRNGFLPFRVFWVSAAMLSAASPAFAQERWWNYGWLYRRAVTFSETVPKNNFPGDDVGVVTMPTGGLMADDGRDICVTTATGAVLRHKVLMIGPGDSVRIAFALNPALKKYFVYFGNSKPPKPQPELQIRRGVLMETRTCKDGGISELRQVKQLFERSEKVLGRDFREDIFIGHNPFGPQNQLCSLFTGWLICPSDGEYLFSTSSQDASFLTIDGNEVVSNGGHHRPQQRAVRQGRIKLTAGLHALQVHHVSTGGDPVIVAAWREPGGRRLWKIPSSAFARVIRGEPGILERYGKSVNADFIPDHSGETFLANRYMQKYSFEALINGGSSGKTEYRWDFGDGQKSFKKQCEHVYLLDGLYKVTLTVKISGQTLTRSNIINVTRPWDRITKNDLDPIADYARMVSNYDFTVIPPGGIAVASRTVQADGVGRSDYPDRRCAGPSGKGSGRRAARGHAALCRYAGRNHQRPRSRG